ncbi:hypothetical protein ETR14_22415 [Sphingosinicella sp. BN140058]|nr:hypothetical protein ETR14_22415 [Sphingosinicella sp. BN140058]
MRKVSKAALVAVFSAASAFAATAALAAAKRADQRQLPMAVRFNPPSACEIRFADQVFSLPDDEDRMIEALRELRKSWRSVTVSGDGNTPYRCIGHAVFVAQRAGFRKGGFTAEPPGGTEQ